MTYKINKIISNVNKTQTILMNTTIMLIIKITMKLLHFYIIIYLLFTYFVQCRITIAIDEIDLNKMSFKLELPIFKQSKTAFMSHR